MRFLHRFRLAVALAIGLLLVPISAYAFTGQVVTGNVTFNASFTEQATAITPYSIPLQVSANLNYTNGTASNQVDTIYGKSVSLASTTSTLDLTTLTDPAGNSINFARVREFIIVNTSTSAGFALNVQAGASNGVNFLPPAANTLICRYGGSIRISDPVSTGASTGNYVDSTHKTITLDSGAHTVTFYILIVGGSAA